MIPHISSNDGKYKGIEIYLNNTDAKHNGRELKDIFAQNFNFLKTNYFHKSMGFILYQVWFKGKSKCFILLFIIQLTAKIY